MLNSILRLFIAGLPILLLLDGGVFAATVDGPNLTSKAVPLELGAGTVIGIDPSEQDPRIERGESVGPVIDKDLVDVFSPTALDDPQAVAVPAVPGEKRPGFGTIAAEPGFILVNLLDTDSTALSRRSHSVLEGGSAGWQILLPSLPDTKFRHLSNAQFSPTFLMFVAGLAGIAFLARCRPRRRGQLGLMT